MGFNKDATYIDQMGCVYRLDEVSGDLWRIAKKIPGGDVWYAYMGYADKKKMTAKLKRIVRDLGLELVDK